MIIILTGLIGGLFGAWRARARAGNGKDIAQYATVHFIIFALVGLMITIILERSL
ncbi:MAG: hypothetical protein ACK5IB_00175 [Qingshengfaniella sp.]